MEKEIEIRLLKHLDFIIEEMEDFVTFREITFDTYTNNKVQRRNIERWIENLINSLIDISKSILLAENITLPQTYKNIVKHLTLIKIFDKENIEKLAELVYLRNILAHEYLDIRWNSISKFVSVQTENYFKILVKDTKSYLSKQA